MITLGLVDSVDDNGVYVTMPGARGLVRGPYATLQNVAAGDRVLVVTTDDGESVVVGLAAASVPGVSIPDGSITSAKIANGTIVNADISGSAAIDRSKISGLPTSSTDNAIARYDGTTGALQNSGVTIDDNNVIVINSEYLYLAPASGSGNLYVVGSASGQNAAVFFRTGGNKRWFVGKEASTESGSDAGSNFRIWRYHDDGTSIGQAFGINRATGKVTIDNVGSSAGIEMGSGGPRIMAGSGSPEGVVTAPVGSLWLRTDSSTTLYVKQTGTGNTGWIAK